METKRRKPYPTDVTDDEWAFVAPYLTLMRPDAPQRVHDPREVYNSLRWIVRAGTAWRLLPNDFPTWQAVYQQARRWIDAGCFEDMVHDLRATLCWADGRADDPTAVILDSRGVQSSPESGLCGPGTTATSAARAARFTLRWTPWAPAGVAGHAGQRPGTCPVQGQETPSGMACNDMRVAGRSLGT